MNYKLFTWPESQTLMDLPGFDEHSSLADEEQFGPCAYFVEEDWLADPEDDFDVDEVITDCLHTLEDQREYEFEEPIEISENRIAKKFWVDDGNEDVRVEIWQTYPSEAWREDAFLSSLDDADAIKVARAIDTYWGL